MSFPQALLLGLTIAIALPIGAHLYFAGVDAIARVNDRLIEKKTKKARRYGLQRAIDAACATCGHVEGQHWPKQCCAALEANGERRQCPCKGYRKPEGEKP